MTGKQAAEPAVAAIVAVVGIALTTYGALTHAGALVAPGSALTLLGGGWLGNVLARRDVRLVPPASSSVAPPESEGR